MRGALDGARVLLVVRGASDSVEATEANYWRVLAERHAAAGLRVRAAGRNDHLVARLFDAIGVREDGAVALVATVDGGVPFVMRGRATPDLLRQVVERAVGGAATTEFSRRVPPAAHWERELRRGIVTRAGDSLAAQAQLAQATHVLLFEAHCSVCRIRNDMAAVKRYAAALGRDSSARLVVLVPAHYAKAPVAAALDSLSVPVLIASKTMWPDLAYVSRDVDAAAPLLLGRHDGAWREERLDITSGGAR